jgi:long-chain acyl-CoA synthetase
MVEPNKPAVIFQDLVTTYRDLHDRIDATATKMLSHFGLSKGDRVVINMENSDCMIIAYLATLRAGGVAIPANPKLVERELRFIISDARPTLYLADADKIEEARAFAGDYKVIVEDTAVLLRSAVNDAAPLPVVEPDDPAVIFYTSGTTGSPKGVIHTHATLKAGAFQCAVGWGYDFPHTALAVTPLFHIAAHGWFYPLLIHNGTFVVDSFKTERCFELIEQYKIQSFNGVPAMLLMMASSEARTRFDLTSVTNVCFGASPMPPEKLSAVQALFPNAQFWHGYGQTEAHGTICVLPAELAYSKNGGVGFPVPSCEVRIVDEHDVEVAPGTHGEVVARGPQIMAGYLNRPDATTETLAGGWLHTGDLGYMDADACIYLVDRKKDMIIRGGENVYSVEIENLLLTNSDLAGCAVFGLPDPVLGERVCAALVPRNDNHEILVAELTALCRKELASFKVPEFWKIVAELPTTATGKIQKALLRSTYGSSDGMQR